MWLDSSLSAMSVNVTLVFTTPQRFPSEIFIRTYPGERVSTDVAGPVTTDTFGNSYFIVFIDHCTKWTEAFPIATIDSKHIDSVGVLQRTPASSSFRQCLQPQERV